MQKCPSNSFSNALTFNPFMTAIPRDCMSDISAVLLPSIDLTSQNCTASEHCHPHIQPNTWRKEEEFQTEVGYPPPLTHSRGNDSCNHALKYLPKKYRVFEWRKCYVACFSLLFYLQLRHWNTIRNRNFCEWVVGGSPPLVSNNPH